MVKLPNNEILKILLRGDVLITTLLTYLVVWFPKLNHSIDFTWHDTYLVLAYQQVLESLIIVFLIYIAIYFLFYLRSTLNMWLTIAHWVFTTIGFLLAVSILKDHDAIIKTSRYYTFIDYPGLYLKVVIILTSVILGAILFIVNLLSSKRKTKLY